MKEGELSTSKGFHPVNPVHPVRKMDPKVIRLWLDAFDAVKTPTAGTKTCKSMV
jgi:hypothetical protein